MAETIESKPPPSVNDDSRTVDQEKTGDVVEMNDGYTREEEKAVLRKIDMTILPLVRLVLAFSSLEVIVDSVS